MPDHRDIHVHVYEGDIAPLERQMTALMAQIDDLQAQFSSLDEAVRTLLSSIQTNADRLQAEIDQLRADDAIEDSKLEGLSSAARDLQGAVDAFGQSAPVEPPVSP